LIQKSREEKEETYDLICLSDIESDDEITEKENPCLPIDFSWMDIHECFNVEEGAPNKKRNRGDYFYLELEMKVQQTITNSNLFVFLLLI